MPYNIITKRLNSCDTVKYTAQFKFRHLLTITPFVDKQWRRLRVGRLDPRREQASLVSLIPEVLIQVGICDLLQGLNIIRRYDMAIKIHELNADLHSTRTSDMV